ncbi:unnamed protein product [Ixodes pacificus]
MAPSVTCIMLLGTALFFLPATGAQCINVTLPNVLGLGECLGTTLRACPDTSDGLLPDLVVILRRVNPTMPEKEKVENIMKGIAEDAFAVLVSRNPTTVAQLQEECQRWEGHRSRRIACPFTISRLQNCVASSGPPLTGDIKNLIRQSIKKELAVLFTPSRRVLQSEPDSILTELVQAVGCILGAAPGAMGLGLARGLVCPLLDIVNSAVTELGNALPLGFLFRAITRITQGLTDNILGSLVSCKPLLWRHS